MCGICGVAPVDTSRAVDRDVLRGMNEAIRHRGPDSDGFHFAPGIGLAARRLAIIDLVTGDQPVANEAGTIVAVFNGEIYNYRELRRDLESRGHSFASDVDTEVLVHLYEEQGDDCVDRLRGMFAFAIWDAPKARLLLARDRVGKKPLYYAEHDGALIFGSELKCVLRYPGIPRDVDLEAIHHYLTLQYVPDPWSAFSAVRKLPPAHRLTWCSGRISIERYWDLDFEPKLEVADGELLETVRDTVSEAVSVRLISDVPLGAHLSGGIDSSIVVGLMATLGGSAVKTFSVGFHENAFSELGQARLIADRFGTDHHELMIAPDATAVLPRMVEHFDEPFADPAAIPLWYLSEFTRRTVTVALNGDGGDEAFGGYQRYYADRVADLYRAVPAALRNAALDPLLHLIPTDTAAPIERSYAAAVRLIPRAARLSNAASVVRWGSYFNEAEKAALYREDATVALLQSPSARLLEVSFASAQARNRLDRTLYTDIHNYLPGALLVKADRMTMAHSLEARSPFLDHRLLELAARLPTRWKVRGRSTKRVLRTAFADLLPAPLRRRGKVGFGVPLAAWLRGPLHDAARDLLLGSDARVDEFLKTDHIAELIRQNRDGTADHGKRIWALLNLECWLRQYVPVAG
jgi:asparagine synthase (glutamine-hydrolysing)